MDERYPGHSQAAAAFFACHDALQPFSENEEVSLDNAVDTPPLFWPSGIQKLDYRTGGFYGMTTVTADAGTGKTMLAVGSAIEAAASQNWQVVHLFAEDDTSGIRERFNLYIDAHPHTASCLGYYHPFSVGCGQTPATVLNDAADKFDLSKNTPLLFVLDSINSIVNLGNMPYLHGLATWGKWAMLARRLSRGNASFLIVSETNSKGNAKGEALNFWSDVILHMKKLGESSVEMNLKKTRRTGGEGELGNFVRSWRTQEFLSESVAELRIVG